MRVSIDIIGASLSEPHTAWLVVDVYIDSIGARSAPGLVTSIRLCIVLMKIGLFSPKTFNRFWILMFPQSKKALGCIYLG